MGDFFRRQQEIIKERIRERDRIYRMEREDPNRGYGEMPEEPTQRERDTVQWWDSWEAQKYWEEYKYYDWEGREQTGYRIKDDEERKWYEYRNRKISEYDDAANKRMTRLPKSEYEERKQEIERRGLGPVKLIPQITGKLISIRTEFPPGFKHLSNEESVRKKMEDAASFRMTLTYTPEVEKNETLRDQLNSFLSKHFGISDYTKINNRDGHIRELKNISVARSGLYQLQRYDDFTHEIDDLQRAGTGKGGLARVSLD